MSGTSIDSYLVELDETKRRTLEDLRRTIMELVPDAEECMAYGAPAFKVRGKAIAGFAAYEKHLSYLPHSGTVLSEVAADVEGYETTKGALKFDADAPLPRALVEVLVRARLREISGPRK